MKINYTFKIDPPIPNMWVSTNNVHHIHWNNVQAIPQPHS
jgi:hypothetical protein